MANFEIALKETLGIEGGKSNNPLDHGGLTYAGISQKNWPHWEGWEIIDRWGKLSQSDMLTLGILVNDFYRYNFWDRISLDSITNQQIANELFDTGVNASPKKAIELLQRALNLLNRNQKLYKDIELDGILGTNTLQLTNNHPYPSDLLAVLNRLQFAYYVAICEKDPTQEEFLRGWLKRTL